MSERSALDQIRRHWTRQAVEHRDSPSASWSDHSVIDMEIRQISQHLNDGDLVLDVGCANGFSTVQFAAQRSIRILGLDYIPEMIEYARRRLEALAGRLRGHVTFEVGNILDLNSPDGHFDKLICTRVLINLGDWSNQLRALRECARVVKPGGLLLLSEATLQGWQRMNSLRREWGLADIPMPAFNTYLDEEKVFEGLPPDLELVELVNFSSTYYVGTRLLKPLLARTSGVEVDVANPDMEWNRWFSQLPAAGDYGTQKLFVLRKCII